MKATDMNQALTHRLVSSPACVPQLTLNEALTAYAGLGFIKFEAFTGWCKSSLDLNEGDPEAYADQARRYGMRFTSMHLPQVRGDRIEPSLDYAVKAARFAQRLGAAIVLFKADTRATCIQAGPRFLEAIDREGIHVTPVVQPHKGTAIETLAHLREVIEGIADDRMKVLLEVGHLHRAGEHWRGVCDAFAHRIALVHINEIRADRSVPYGEGEVDFAGLFNHLGQVGYAGDIVLELELDTRDDDADRTLREIGKALAHLGRCGLEELA